VRGPTLDRALFRKAKKRGFYGLLSLTRSGRKAAGHFSSGSPRHPQPLHRKAQGAYGLSSVAHGLTIFARLGSCDT